ncbi:hypothetical protein HPB50_028820 [Hyalomma asiaticum]|nr:hypothetical protein HPB50_028820 [Hyalomma asiaticum]
MTALRVAVRLGILRKRQCLNYLLARSYFPRVGNRVARTEYTISVAAVLEDDQWSRFKVGCSYAGNKPEPSELLHWVDMYLLRRCRSHGPSVATFPGGDAGARDFSDTIEDLASQVAELKDLLHWLQLGTSTASCGTELSKGVESPSSVWTRGIEVFMRNAHKVAKGERHKIDRIGSLGEERRDGEIEGITARRLRLAAPPVTAASAALRLGTRRKPEHPIAIYDGDEARPV